MNDIGIAFEFLELSTKASNTFIQNVAVEVAAVVYTNLYMSGQTFTTDRHLQDKNMYHWASRIVYFEAYNR